jgi:hypothetical protein
MECSEGIFTSLERARRTWYDMAIADEGLPRGGFCPTTGSRSGNESSAHGEMTGECACPQSEN